MEDNQNKQPAPEANTETKEAEQTEETPNLSSEDQITLSGDSLRNLVIDGVKDSLNNITTEIKTSIKNDIESAVEELVKKHLKNRVVISKGIKEEPKQSEFDKITDELLKKYYPNIFPN